MLKKLRLDQTKKYEQSIATNEIVKMLVAFVKGKKHHLYIGAEQGDIFKWDDLIIQDEPNSYIHIQVKRQTTDFSRDPIIRDTYKQGTRLGMPRDLSPFDETLKSLADWIKDIDPTTVNQKREFWIVLPEGNTEIKSGLEIRHLKSLCETQIKSATTVDKLEQLAEEDSTVKSCYNWLTTWCNFEDWEHILKSLRILKIKTEELESVINNKTEDLLKDIFCTDKVSEIRLKIISYTDENSAYTVAIKPRQLLFKLKDYLLPTIATWTQFEKVDSHWNISGIHDLEFNDKIERPSVVVPSLWKNDKIRDLKINATVNENCKLSESLMHLAIHLKGKVNTYCKNENDWKSYIKNKVGGTIGIDENDLDDLSISENTEIFSTSDIKTIGSRREQENISEELNTEMLAKTWTLVVKDIENKLYNLGATELRDAVEQRWNIWKPKLENYALDLKNLFQNILHPTSEGEDICGELRIGTKTVKLLASALLLLLVVSVCLDECNDGDWQNISSNLSVKTIGLQFWSGPAGNRRVKEIAEDGKEIIGKEKVDLLIMSKVQDPPSDIMGLDIMESSQYENTLANGKQLKLLVTNNTHIKLLIRDGKIEPLKDFLNKELKKRSNANIIAIQNAKRAIS